MRMQHHIAATLLATVFLVLGGCSPEDDPPPAASIGGGAIDPHAPDPIKPRVLNLPPDRYDNETILVDSPQTVAVSDASPLVVLTTTLGKITLKLDRAAAPNTVDNFLVYVNEGFYDKTIFHQVDDGFVLVAGGYTADLKAKPTRTAIRNEAHNGLKNRRGTIAMVSLGGIDSATTQFLINLQDNPQLDHKSREIPVPGEAHQYGFCVFGEIVDGWDVVGQIAKSRVQASGQFARLPTRSIAIESAQRVADTSVARKPR